MTMHEEKGTAERLAAYSDAVFAVIVIIMVLELKIMVLELKPSELG